MRKGFISAVIGALVLPIAGTCSAVEAAAIRNIVIVHGAFADGSGWRKVSDRLVARGYNVTVVQQPLTSLQDDVAATRRALALQDGPVISDAGNDPKVAGLVYIAAFQPEKGESLAKLAGSKPVPNAAPDAIKATADGYLYLDPARFAAAFAADLPKAEAAFLAHSQVFAAQAAFATEAGEPAWKRKPSWALVASDDRSINPALERDIATRAGSTVREVAASHAVYASKPAEVAELIAEAAGAVSR